MIYPKYQKKPVVIEAVEYTGKNPDEIYAFVGEENIVACEGEKLMLRTLEGQHIASAGDFIIKGIKGEFYPCKPDIFKASYDRV